MHGHYFRTKSCEAVKQACLADFPDAAVPAESTIFRLVKRHRSLQNFKSIGQVSYFPNTFFANLLMPFHCRY